MSRRSHTVLILQVRIPVPAGKTQQQTVEWVKEKLVSQQHETREAFTSPQTLVKLTGRETQYL